MIFFNGLIVRGTECSANGVMRADTPLLGESVRCAVAMSRG
jgi:hypothetical protein